MSPKEKFSKLMLEPILIGPPNEILQHPDMISLHLSEAWAWKEAKDYVPKPVLQALKEAVDGSYLHCSFSTLPGFHEAIARKVTELSRIEVRSEKEILVSPGASRALHIAALAFLDPGDELLTTDPTWVDAIRGGHLTGATIKFIQTRTGNGWRFSPDEIESEITPKTKLLWLTDPDNPTGRVFTRKEVEDIASIVIEHDLIVVVDQASNELLMTA